jgi:hypothetical protein
MCNPDQGLADGHRVNEQEKIYEFKLFDYELFCTVYSISTQVIQTCLENSLIMNLNFLQHPELIGAQDMWLAFTALEVPSVRMSCVGA